MALLVVAAALRIWQLGDKPLWIDELYTIFYSLGKSPAIISLHQIHPLSDYRALLMLSSDATSLDAQQAVATLSNHPPAFFMLMNRWMQVFGTSILAVRSLAVMFGVLLVGAVWLLGRQLGQSVGWIAAILITVSPYGVYLSQEARHYTLPMLISALALMVWLHLLRSLYQHKRLRWQPLIGWVMLNGLGFYTHYFYVLGVLVQWGILIAQLYRWRSSRRDWGLVISAIVVTGLCYLVWLPVMLHQSGSEEATQWLSPDQTVWELLLLPGLRSLAAWVMMVILLPVEQVPLWITIPSALMMLGVWGWGIREMILGWGILRKQALTNCASMILASLQLYVLGVFALMIGIVYGLHKDLTLAPRYFFILYPALTVIMAAGWGGRERPKLLIWGLAGLVSILLMGWNWTLLKPYWPDNIGQRLAASQEPRVVVMVAREPVRRLLGLSYALTLPDASATFWGFTTGIPESGDVRSQLTGWEHLPASVASLWLLEPQRTQPFPSRVILPNQTCVATGTLVNTQGTRQQAYRCYRRRENRS
jgi:uncharacterized membrane protein